MKKLILLILIPLFSGVLKAQNKQLPDSVKISLSAKQILKLDSADKLKNKGGKP